MAPRRGIDHADGYSLERTEVGTLRMRRQLAKTREDNDSHRPGFNSSEKAV